MRLVPAHPTSSIDLTEVTENAISVVKDIPNSLLKNIVAETLREKLFGALGCSIDVAAHNGAKEQTTVKTTFLCHEVCPSAHLPEVGSQWFAAAAGRKFYGVEAWIIL